MTVEEAKNRISDAFRRLLPASDSNSQDILPKTLTAGKLYEAYVLSLVAEKLSTVEGYELRLVNSNYLTLKSAPGPINRSFPRIELRRNGGCQAEVWTDVEFLSLSCSLRTRTMKPQRCDYHELDILIVNAGLSGRPRHDQIMLGVECKNTAYDKGLLKQILGIRREMSLLQDSKVTFFRRWPRQQVPADPSSCLLVYSTDPGVMQFADPGETFGIDFIYEPLEP